MDVFQAIRERRSIRGLSVEQGPVKDDDLAQILEAARLAPSDCNSQPWHFFVIRNRDLVQTLSAKVDRRVDERIAAGDAGEAKKWENYRRFFTHFGSAPVLIAISYQPTTVDGYPVHFSQQVPYNPNLQSIGAAVQNMVLAAQALGYSTCWMTGPVDSCRDELQDLIGTPPGYVLSCFLSVGVPTRNPSPRPRKALAEIVTYID
ncbi:MAG: nitroreductase family protein [Chloroflexi bacterium]|nr:nitroreductase family protein [Chloroflexota bacterium]